MLGAVAALPLHAFATLSDPEIAHGVSTRAGGVSRGAYATLNLGSSVGDESEHVAENRSRFARALGFPPERLITTPQVHGTSVLAVDSTTAAGALQTRADILISDCPGYLLMQRFADCVPLLFWHPEARAVGVAHAGWRGTALGVGARTVEALASTYGAAPSGLRAAIGPSIGPCCFEVGEEVVAAFPAVEGAVSDGSSGRPHLDLWELNRRALVAAGVPPDKIELSNVCTRCHGAQFFSHRELGYPAGRFGAAIALTPMSDRSEAQLD